MIVDLFDELGNLKYLVDYFMIYVIEILKVRELFVLIRVESKLFISFCVFYFYVKKVVYDLVRFFLLL